MRRYLLSLATTAGHRTSGGFGSWRSQQTTQGEIQMTDVKKDHNIGAGTGAAAGAATGAAIGAAGGPVGMAVGAIIGGVVGAKAGDSIAEAVNPTTYNSYWNDNYSKADY